MTTITDDTIKHVKSICCDEDIFINGICSNCKDNASLYVEEIDYFLDFDLTTLAKDRLELTNHINLSIDYWRRKSNYPDRSVYNVVMLKQTKDFINTKTPINNDYPIISVDLLTRIYRLSTHKGSHFYKVDWNRFQEKGQELAEKLLS